MTPGRSRLALGLLCVATLAVAVAWLTPSASSTLADPIAAGLLIAAMATLAPRRSPLRASGDPQAGLKEPDRQILHKAIAFSGKSVGEVMVPRPDMACVRAEAGLDEIFEVAGRTSHTRLPVFDGDVDHILGFIHAKDLLKIAPKPPPDATARDLMRPILAVPENKGINAMLREFQRAKTHVAIVFDEFGGTAGMVTINDLLEELVGELVDEWREGGPEVEPLSDGSVRLQGLVAIDDVNERFGLALPDHEFNTIAGLIFGRLGRTPEPGDVAEIEGVRFRVETTNGRRATSIVMRLDLAGQAP